MDIFKILFGGYVKGLLDLSNDLFRDTFKTAMQIETSISSVNVWMLYMTIAGFAFGILTVKILHKLLGVYVFNIDGDSTTSPAEYVKLYIKAIITIFSFTFLYSFMVDIVMEFFANIYKILNITYNTSILTDIINTADPLKYILCFIYLICMVALQINIYMNGITIFILRLGIPLATISMIDGNNNKFTATMNIVYKLIITIIAQLTLFSLSVAVLGNGDPKQNSMFISIGFMLVAFGIVQNFGELFAMGAGSGIMRKGVNVAREVWQTSKIIIGGK